MLPTFEVGDALGVADVLTERLSENTSQTAKKLYKVLVALSVEAMRARGHVPSVSSVLIHAPGELVAAVAGVSRISYWRHLRALKAAGAVDYRVHKARCRGLTRNSGTVFRVKLQPDSAAPKLSFQDMKFKHRDLDRDVRAGRTSYAVLKRLKHTDNLSQEQKLNELKTFSLPPQPPREPVTHVCFSRSRPSLESVLDLTSAGRDDRAAAVDAAAQAVSQALRDASSLDWYRRLMWQLLRRYDSTGRDEGYALFLACQRAAVDAQEWSELRRPGALLVSRLRASEAFAAMLNGPPVRVGVRPIAA